MFPSVTFARNHRSSSAGIPGHLQPETPVIFVGIRSLDLTVRFLLLLGFSTART
jgi:hypothetical protein